MLPRPAARTSRHARVVFALGTTFIVALLFATALLLQRFHDDELKDTERTLANLNLILAEQTDRAFQSVDLILQSLVERLQTAHIDSSVEYTLRMGDYDIHRMLRDKISGVPQVDALTLINADGKLINFSRYWPIPEVNVADRDYFMALKTDPKLTTAISAPVRNRGTGTWTIYLARRVSGPEGEFIGLVLGAMVLQYFEDFYQAITPDTGGSIFLARTDGMLLARYPRAPDQIGKTFVEGALFSQVSRRHDHGTTRERSSVDGEARIKSIRRLKNYPIAVAVTLTEQAALTDWREQARVLGAAGVGIAVAIGLVMALIARQLRARETILQAHSERSEAERARAVAETELLKKERLSALGQLTGTVAHELRNPLSAIRNTMFTLRQLAGGGDTKFQRPLARMERSVTRCDRIIGDLLDFTRVRELKPEVVAFDAWLTETLDEYLPADGVTLERRLGAPEATSAIDADRLFRVVINLLDNAVQAMAGPGAGSSEKRITVRTTERGGRIELEIADTGPGIPNEHLSRVFEPLFSTKGFGTGLGLSTVKQIVELHGGDIAISSAVGHGASVLIHLPRAEAGKVAA